MRPDVLVAILGAGRSSRFGNDKLHQPCRGKPLGLWSLEAALRLGQRVIWIAASNHPCLVDGRCDVIVNPKHIEGIGTSIAIAAEAARVRGADMLLLMLADMPLVSSNLLQALIDHGAPAASRYPDGKLGVPALFPKSMLTVLESLSGDEGASSILRGMDNVRPLDGFASQLLDVDAPDDLAAAERAFGSPKS